MTKANPILTARIGLVAFGLVMVAVGVAAHSVAIIIPGAVYLALQLAYVGGAGTRQASGER